MEKEKREEEEIKDEMANEEDTEKEKMEQLRDEEYTEEEEMKKADMAEMEFLRRCGGRLDEEQTQRTLMEKQTRMAMRTDMKMSKGFE